MIFEKQRDNWFNIPNSLYRRSFNYHYVFFPNLPISNTQMPKTASSISPHKNVTLKKGYSELLERIGMSYNAFQKKENIICINLIDGEIKETSIQLSKYNLNPVFYSDTTGTATNISSEESIQKALFEMIEKNDLFLFWYGYYGKVILYKDIKNKISKEIAQYITFYNLKVSLVIVEEFFPIVTMICLIETENYEFYSSGISANTNILMAIQDSILEALLLKQNNLILNVYHKELDSSVFFKKVRPIFFKSIMRLKCLKKISKITTLIILYPL
ncbi:YcaO-like family protein [Aerococcus urinaeequi]|uniref:YcaO-like family protein n=1 Tax=Aerococcus urinaeequi TaxID=51665 RepID=UPI003D6BB7F7